MIQYLNRPPDVVHQAKRSRTDVGSLAMGMDLGMGMDGGAWRWQRSGPGSCAVGGAFRRHLRAFVFV